jgi:hypothetical protein
MVPDEPAATDPLSVGSFLEGLDSEYGTAIWLFSLLDVSLGKIATAFEKAQPAGDPYVPILMSVIFSLTAFAVGGFAVICEQTRQGNLCSVGILALWFSAFAISYTTYALAKLVMNLGELSVGAALALGIFTLTILVASGFSFAGDSGYVLKHCG